MTHVAGDLPELLPRLLAQADQALVRSVDALSEHQYAEPSHLPGWTRAHVVAHLALNAEALAGVLHGAHVGRPRPMYPSQDARDRDIDELARQSPSELRERLLAGTGQFGDTLAAMHEDDWPGRFERTPGAQQFHLTSVPLMRLREVEIHHADLDAGYSAADWTPEFCVVLLDSMAKFDRGAPLEVRPTDLDRTWRYGEDGDGPVVTGTAAALGWWLTGRGTGEGLTSDTGTLPEMEAW